MMFGGTLNHESVLYISPLITVWAGVAVDFCREAGEANLPSDNKNLRFDQQGAAALLVVLTTMFNRDADILRRPDPRQAPKSRDGETCRDNSTESICNCKIA